MQWVQGWANSGFSRPYNGGSNRAYNGLNRFILSFEAMERGWTDPRFFTFKQASDEGYSVKKGEKSTRVEYWAVWDDVEKKSISISEYRKILKSDLDEDRYRLYSKAAYVFNAHQLNNIELLPVVSPQHNFQENRLAEEVLSCLSQNMDVPIHYGGDRAYYSPTGDYVQMPQREAFFTAEDYYSTLGHELSHATGAASRLNRPMDSLYANAESYALEELRAEIASTYFCAELGVNISDKALESHQAYVASWLKAIKEDHNALFAALKDADKIADYMMEQGRVELGVGDFVGQLMKCLCPLLCGEKTGILRKHGVVQNGILQRYDSFNGRFGILAQLTKKFFAGAIASFRKQFLQGCFVCQTTSMDIISTEPAEGQFIGIGHWQIGNHIAISSTVKCSARTLATSSPCALAQATHSETLFPPLFASASASGI